MSFITWLKTIVRHCLSVTDHIKEHVLLYHSDLFIFYGEPFGVSWCIAM